MGWEAEKTSAWCKDWSSVTKASLWCQPCFQYKSKPQPHTSYCWENYLSHNQHKNPYSYGMFHWEMPKLSIMLSTGFILHGIQYHSIWMKMITPGNSCKMCFEFNFYDLLNVWWFFFRSFRYRGFTSFNSICITFTIKERVCIGPQTHFSYDCFPYHVKFKFLSVAPVASPTFLEVKCI